MDIQMAVSIVQFLELEHSDFWEPFWETVADALNKRIPTSPLYEGDGYSEGKLVLDTWYCPCCNTAYEVDYDHYKFCPNCGQAILLDTQPEKEADDNV